MSFSAKVFFLIVLSFLLLKSINIAPKISDENIYFYMASLLANGQFPYRDFFFAHLPGQLLILAIPIKLFGFNLFTLKLVPILASAGTAILLYLKTKNIFPSVFYLFSLSVLATSDHGSGVHEATFFLTLSWYLFDKKKPLWAGLALFVGMTVRFYILPAALGFAAYHVWQSLKNKNSSPISRISRFALAPARRALTSPVCFLLFTFTLFAATNLIFLQLFGDHFFTPVWKYHLLKSEGIDKGAIIAFFLKNDWILLVLASVGIITLLINKLQIQNYKSQINPNKSSSKSKTVSSFGNLNLKNYLELEILNLNFVYSALYTLLFQSFFFIFFADIYFLYLVTLIPFLAILAAQGVAFINQKLYPNIPYAPYFPYFLLTIFFLLNFLNYQTNHAAASVITSMDKIVEDIKATTNSQDKIFGSFSVAPLAALKANRGLTDNQVDTNIKRYLAGFLSTEETTKLATESTVFIQTGVIDQQGKALNLDPAFVKQEVIQNSCKVLRVYSIPKDYANNAIILWKCK